VKTAVIGVGNIGRALAGHLVDAGEQVVLAASEKPGILAKQFGELGSAASVPEAIEVGDAIIFAVWFDVMKDLIGQHQARLPGKVVVDPSNPIAMDEKGDFSRTLPDRVSAGSVISGMLPPTAHYVKAFGTLSAKSLRKAANRTPQKAVLFYATDDRRAQKAVERLMLLEELSSKWSHVAGGRQQIGSVW
jgi:8-hydroxy-5-deazaflavin:NADPH oxidoreductase